jgi:hypothetical protein
MAKFTDSLKRNNSKIREDRATAISEDAEMLFKRTVEDIALEIKRTKRDRENMLDMSPDSADSLKVASDFDSVAFVAKDLDLGWKLRNLEIKYEIATARYVELFGDLPQIAEHAEETK